MKGRRPSLALLSAAALLCPIAGLGQTPMVADSVTRQALEAKADPARGKTVFDRDCVECHGGSGEGRAAKFAPMVAAQHHGYLLRELDLIRSGERGNSDPAMVKALARYAADDLPALADFMSQLPVPKR